MIKIIDRVPTDYMSDTLKEIQSINWEKPDFIDARRLHPIFTTSYAVHLRIPHNTSGVSIGANNDGGYRPGVMANAAKIINCVDSPIRYNYMATDKIVSWIYNRVDGKKMGRIMLVNLLAGGVIPEHTDEGDYFKYYKRFHVPLITNDMVRWTCGKVGESYFMPAGQLIQLDNLKTHGLKNLSSKDRIHLLIDIATDNNDFVFN